MRSLDASLFESGNLVAGKWISEGERVDIKSPYTGQTIGSIFMGNGKHLETAIAGAVASFADLRELASCQRKEMLLNVASAIRREADTFIRLMALEAGKPVKAARVEVDRAVLTFTTAAEEAVRISGEYLPLDFIPATRGR